MYRISYLICRKLWNWWPSQMFQNTFCQSILLAKNTCRDVHEMPAIHRKTMIIKELWLSYYSPHSLQSLGRLGYQQMGWLLLQAKQQLQRVVCSTCSAGAASSSPLATGSQTHIFIAALPHKWIIWHILLSITQIPTSIYMSDLLSKVM